MIAFAVCSTVVCSIKYHISFILVGTNEGVSAVTTKSTLSMYGMMWGAREIEIISL